MAVLFFQIGIFIIIQIAAFFGRGSRNLAVILISIFTILQVFTAALMIIQFITIIISFTVSQSILANENKKGKDTKPSRPSRPSSNLDSYGLTADNPVLMRSIPSSYYFLGRLSSFRTGLIYDREGSVGGAGFDRPVDKYVFKQSGRYFATV